MSIEVEITLRVPSLTVRSSGNPDRRIDNGSIRFSKRITVEAVPKSGELLRLSTHVGDPFDCTVTRLDWSDDKNLFVVACAYGRRSITAEEYDALVNDPEWATKQLP